MILVQSRGKLQRMRTLLLLQWEYCSLGSQLVGHAHDFSHFVCCASEDLQHCVIAWKSVVGERTEDLSTGPRCINNDKLKDSNHHQLEDGKRGEDSNEQRHGPEPEGFLSVFADCAGGTALYHPKGEPEAAFLRAAHIGWANSI